MIGSEAAAKVRLALAVAGCAAVLAGAPAAAGEGTEVALYAGSYDLAKTRSLEAGVEFRFRSRVWELVPAVGATATEDGAFWGYAGLRRPFRLGPGWRLTPGFAVAFYEEGSTGKDLGGPVQFRSSLELSRRFGGGSSLGLAAYHVSNARIYEDNPGSNSLILSWAFPLAGR